MLFDFESFLKRKKLKQREAAELFGVSQATISNWSKGLTPDFSTLCKMISEGITAQELFGTELGKSLVENSICARNSSPDSLFNSSEFKECVEQAILRLRSKGAI